MKKKFEVDNSGQGNCMYYAYSISLMTFLRINGTKDMAEGIFAKLNLDAKQKDLLHRLLNDAKGRQFNFTEIKTIIEPILGPATRKLAAEYTAKEFLDKPNDSSTYTAAVYGITYQFKQQLQTNDSPLAYLITNDFTNITFTDAEIFKVSGMADLMRVFTEAQILDVVLAFEKRWAAKELQLNHPSEQVVAFNQGEILDILFREKTIEFFKANGNAHLNKYTAHLNTNYKWGTEETLLTLHRAITGERKVMDKNGQWTQNYDVAINIQIFENGVLKAYHSGEPDIILNNKGNFHWTSLVPPENSELDAAKSDATKSDAGKSEAAKSEAGKSDAGKSDVGKSDAGKSDAGKSDAGKSDAGKSDADKSDAGKSDADKSNADKSNADKSNADKSNADKSNADKSNASKSDADKTNTKRPPVFSLLEQQVRENVLENIGINGSLIQLLEKAKNLRKRGYIEEADQAFDIYDALNATKEQFIAHGTKETRIDDLLGFAEICKIQIKEAPKDRLEKHRGFEPIWTFILNALITLVTFSSVNFYMGEFQIIKPSETKSIQALNLVSLRGNSIFNKSTRELQTIFDDQNEETQDDTPKFDL